MRRQRRELIRADSGRRLADVDVGAISVSKITFENHSSTYVEMPPGEVLPAIRRSQASAHSRMTSMA